MLDKSELANIGRNGADLIKDELEENFHKKKRESLLLADSYERLKVHKKAVRVRSCGTYLKYRIDPNRLNEQGYQRLYKAYLCGDMLCPICQWRRSRKIFNQLVAIMEHIKGYRFIFVTLTVQNMLAEELYPAVDNMLGAAWHTLVNNRRFKGAVHGYFRTLEVTHDTDPVITEKMHSMKKAYYKRRGLNVGDANPSYDTYHPHIHAILAVEPEYFSKDNNTYIHQKEWRELWRKSLHIAYDPFVFVETIYSKNSGEKGVKNKKSNVSAILEAAKYTAKSYDYLVRGTDRNVDEVKTDEAVYTISTALANRRLFSYGGVFRATHKELHLDSVNDGNLIHIETNAKTIKAEYIYLSCVWNGKGGYRVGVID